MSANRTETGTEWKMEDLFSSVSRQESSPTSYAVDDDNTSSQVLADMFATELNDNTLGT